MNIDSVGNKHGIRTAVILSGGTGSRMGSASQSTPKPLLPINGVPVLAHQLKWLRREGVQKVILLAGYLSEKIEQFADQESSQDFEIKVVSEKEPLGTAGALAQLKDILNEEFLCLYGDLILDLDLSRLYAFHRSKNSELTLVVHPNDHPYDSDLVEVDSNERITKIHAKPHATDLLARNLVNAAVYLIKPEILQKIEMRKHDLAQNAFPSLIEQGRHVFAYSTPEYLKDMGTPSRLAQVEDALNKGKVEKWNLRYSRPVVFLDRDGVICKQVDQLSRLDQFELNPGAGAAIRLLNQAGFLTIVVTNQPMIAKGFLNLTELERIHRYMEMELGRSGAWVDRIYFCPHHPDQGFAGEVPELKINCRCRKPETGMLESARTDFNLNLKRSWLIGDSWRDIQAGKSFGVATIGIGVTGNFSKFKPDFVAVDLDEAVGLILEQKYE